MKESPVVEIRSRLAEKFERELGDKIVSTLADPDTIEVIVNPDGRVWIEKHSAGMEMAAEVMPLARVENLIGTVAALLGAVVNRDRPLIEGELPDGSRFQGTMPPVSGGPAFVIRKRASRVFALEEYVASGILTEAHWVAIRQAIQRRENILVAGGTGSGKTTLVNGILAEMVALGDTRERFVVIEDTLELRCLAPNTLHLHTCEAADLTRLVRTTMRLRPDRIVIGEVRGPEALALLKAWNTGHPGGITTIHADGVLGALRRLEGLVEEAGVPPRPELIVEAVGLVVFMTRLPGGGRRIVEVSKVTGWDARSGYQLAPIKARQTEKERFDEEATTVVVHGFAAGLAGLPVGRSDGGDEWAGHALGHATHDDS